MEKDIENKNNKKTWYYLAFSFIIICIISLIYGFVMYSIKYLNKIDYIVNVISVSTIICVIIICLTVITLRIVDKEYAKKDVSDDFVEKCLKHFGKQSDLNSQEKKNLDTKNISDLPSNTINVESEMESSTMKLKETKTSTATVNDNTTSNMTQDENDSSQQNK